jgi:hypothetical protein
MTKRFRGTSLCLEMTHIFFRSVWSGKKCASSCQPLIVAVSDAIKVRGNVEVLLVPSNDAHSLPDRIDGKRMCVIVSGGVKITKQLTHCSGVSFYFRFFALMLTSFSVPYWGPFRVSVGLFGCLHTPWMRSTKPFTKRLTTCPGMSVSISDVLPLCSPTSQYLTVVRFAWAWACLDTYTLPEHAAQNRLRNGYVLVQVCHFLSSPFCPYAHQLLSILLWSVLRERGLV